MELFCDFVFDNSKYTCLILDADIIKPGTVISDISGDHLEGLNNQDVEVIEFKNTAVVHFLPTNLLQIFPQATELFINRCGLRRIHHEDLQGLEQLRTLNLHSNVLTMLPEDLLLNMENLKEISFANNKLGSLTSKVLEPIKDNDLDFLDFRDNPSINCFFKKENGGSKSLGTVEEVMEVIDSTCIGPYDDNESYEELSESLEKDEQEEDYDEADSEETESLGSDEEFIEVIDSDSSEPLEEAKFEDHQSFQATEMYSKNAEEDLEAVVFKSHFDCTYEDIQWRDDPSLYTCCVTSADINLQGTIVDSLSGQHKIRKDHSNVQAIDLAKQKVEFFPRGIASIFKNLIALSIEKCGLKTVTCDDLIGLENLQQFYLGKNLLTCLSDDLFLGMTKLTQISFNGNQINRMSSQLIRNIADNQLTYVDFRNNPAIDVKYEPKSMNPKNSVASLEELFRTIDEKCGQQEASHGKSSESKSAGMNPVKQLVDKLKPEIEEPKAKRAASFQCLKLALQKQSKKKT
jgi:Leucine-rich repeat (LRR) protein